MEQPVGFLFAGVFGGFSLLFCFLFGGPFVYSHCTLGAPYAFYNISVYLSKKQKMLDRSSAKLMFCALSVFACDCALSGQVLATICEELSPDGVILVYLSASGYKIIFVTTPGFDISVYSECEPVICSCISCH